MALSLRRVRRRIRRLDRRAREARALARAIQAPHRPVLAQIIPTRRCNLSCAYCNEYDQVSAPVPLPVMQERVDRLAALGTGIITLSGGEPLLHPDVAGIIAHIRHRGAIATLITNGYLLSRRVIAGLDEAGLDSLQISIDNIVPDDVSKKSLKVLDAKLRLLAETALFDVTVNAVVGGAGSRPEDALAIATRARELGFGSTVGILHDDRGQLVPLGARERQVLQQIHGLDRSAFSFDRYNRFQDVLAAGTPYAWHCPAGGRYLYVCEDGLVHYCSQQRGYPGVPLDRYTRDDVVREAAAPKACAPFCSIGCVHRVAMIDDLRTRPAETIDGWFAGAPSGMPVPVRLLRRILVTGPEARLVRSAARLMIGRPSASRHGSDR